MSDAGPLLTPIRKRVEAYRDHGTPGLHAPQDRARLLAAIDAADAALAANAAAFDETAKRLIQQVLDRDPDRDAEAANRYSNYATTADAALRTFRAAVVAALGEGL